jgi:hypothetical protein
MFERFSESKAGGPVEPAARFTKSADYRGATEMLDRSQKKK